MAADPGSERWEATWEEGRLTEDRLGDHTAMRYRHFRRFVDVDDGVALDEELYGYMLSAEGIRDEMKQYEAATAIVRLAETGFYVRKLREMNSLLDAVRGSCEEKDSPELAEWRSGLQQERNERMKLYDELLATERVDGDEDGASDRIWEMTDDLEVEEALTLLKSGVDKYIDDTLTDQEISKIQTAFSMIAWHSDMIVTTIPDWFVSPYTWEGSYGLSRRGNNLFVPEHSDRDRVIRDATIWSRLNHPHIVKFLGACHVGIRPFFVHENVRALPEVLSGESDREVVWRRLREVALCLLYLSERGLGFGGFSIHDVCCAQYEDKVVMRGVGLIDANVGMVESDDSISLGGLPLSSLMILDMRALGVCIVDALYLLNQATENNRTHSFDEGVATPGERNRELSATRPTFITEVEWMLIVKRLTDASPSLSVAPIIKHLSIISGIKDIADTSDFQLIAEPLARNREVYDIVVPSVGVSIISRLTEDIGIGAPLIHFVSDRLQGVQSDVQAFAILLRRNMQPLFDFRDLLKLRQSYRDRAPSLTPLASRIVLTRLKTTYEAVKVHSEDNSVISAWNSLWEQECQGILETAAANVCTALLVCNEEQRNEFLQLLQYELQKHKDEYSESYRSTVTSVLSENESEAVNNSPNHDWFIPWYEIELLELPPRNRNGQSVRGVWEGNVVVVTYISDHTFGDDASFQHYVSKWFALKHPNVVKLVGACHVGIRCIVCEPVDCSLADLRHHPTVMPWRHLLAQVACGLKFLHDQGIVHGDVRARHIFVKDGVAKLGRLFFRLRQLRGHFADLSLRWMAPELLTNHTCSSTSDVYSFGMTIIEVATKLPPWKTIGLNMIVRRRVLDRKLPDQPRSSELKFAEWELITRKVCAFEPGQRSSMSVVVQHLADLHDVNGDAVAFVIPESKQTVSMLDEWRSPWTQILVAGELEELEAKCKQIFDPDLECTWIYKCLQDVWDTLHEIDESDLKRGHEAIERCTRLISNWNKCLGLRLDQHPLERFELPRPFLDQVERLRRDLIDLCADFEISSFNIQTINFKAHALSVVKRFSSSSELDILPVLSIEQLEEILTSLMVIAKHRRGEYDPEYCDALAEYVDRIAHHKQLELTAPEWYVRRSDVSSDLVRSLGDPGAIKSVRRSAWHDGSVVAVKYVWKNVSSAFVKCVEKWRGFDNHPHVLHLHGACHVGSPQFLVCEFARKGNFDEYFRDGKNAHVRWQRFLEASKGLHHLHDQNHAHGNIRPTNLLVGGDGKARVGDIGFAEFNRKCIQVGELDAFPRDLWSAPELSEEESMTSSTDADIYAFGMCILASYLDEEELSQRFECCSLDGILDDTLRPSEMEEDGWGLVKKMCSRDSSTRPKAYTVERSLEVLAKNNGGESGNDVSIYLTANQVEDPFKEAIWSLDDLAVALEAVANSMASVLHDRLRAFHMWVVGPDKQPSMSVVRRCQRLADRLVTVLNARFDSSIKFFELITSRRLAAVVFDLHKELDYLEEILDVPDEYRLPKWKAEWDEQRRCQIDELVTACDSLNDLSPEKIHEALQYLQFEKAMYRGSYPAKALENFGAIVNATAMRLAISSLLPVWFVPPYEIDFQQIGKSLGEGGLGKVYRGEWQGMNVAVKTVLSEDEVKNTYQCATSNKMFANEASVWFRLNHPHVIKLYCACPIVTSWISESQPQQRYFVCEFAGKGTLKDFVAEGEDQSSAERPREVWKKLYEAALGLQYLHECGIVHGDLKGENILIGSDNRAKLSDFGSSTVACANAEAEKPMGSFRWMAPECLRKKAPQPLSVASDIYSFGMCILETISENVPWCNIAGNSPLPVRYWHSQKQKNKKIPPRPTGFSDSQWSLVKDMCRYDPNKRISLQEAIQRLAVEADIQEMHARDRAVIRPCDRDAVHSAIAKLEEKCSQMKESEALVRLMHGRLEQLCDGLQALDDPLFAQQHQRRFLVENVVDRLILSLGDHKDQVELMRLATNSAFLEGLTAIRDEIHGLFKMWGLADTVGVDFEWDKAVQAQKDRLIKLSLQSQQYFDQRTSEAPVREALVFVETLVKFPSPQMSPDDLLSLDNVWMKVKAIRQITKSLARGWFLPKHTIAPPPTNVYHCSFPHGSIGQVELKALKYSNSSFDSQLVAVKSLVSGENGLTDLILKLLDAWFEMSHPNVIKLIGAHHISTSPFVVSEYVSNGNFASYMATTAGKMRMWQLFLEAALGLQYLHSMEIIHGNLKSTNLLVDANGKAKLSDFGFSKLLDQSKSKSTERERDGIRWMAPELLIADPDAKNPASDVFSFGRCLAAALTGAPPLADQSDDDIITALMEETPYTKPEKPYIDDEHWKLVQELCEVDPMKRLTIKQAIDRFRQFAGREEQQSMDR